MTKFNLFAIVLMMSSFVHAAELDQKDLAPSTLQSAVGTAIKVKPLGGRWCLVAEGEEPPPECIPGE